MKKIISQWLFVFAKNKCIGEIVGFGFQFFSQLIPVENIVNTDKIISFYHPKPTYNDHMLLVPKKRISTFISLVSKNIEYLYCILGVINMIQEKKQFSLNEYILAVNGGCRQEVYQVHFHFFKYDINFFEKNENWIENIIYENENFSIISLSNTRWEVYVKIIFNSEISSGIISNKNKQKICNEAFDYFKKLEKRYDFSERGYTVFFQKNNNLVIHITAGKK